MTPLDAYKILWQRHTNEDRLMGERSTAFLAGSSILFLGFVTLLRLFSSSWLLYVIPILGLLLCLFAILSNGRTKKALDFWMKCEEWLEENESSFDYMKKKRKIDTIDTTETDMLPSSFRQHVGLFMITNRKIYAFFVPGVFVALWGASLAWVLCPI